MNPNTVAVVSLTRGPLLGTCLGSFLYGITCLQAFFYYQTYVDDRRELKLMVASLLAFESIHVAFSIWVMDNYLIVNYSNPNAIQTATWLTTTTYITGFFVDLLVYLYFTWRIWSFTGKLWVVFFMLFIAISRTVLSIVACILSVLTSTWVHFLQHQRVLILISNTLFIIGDAFSAIAMAFHLKIRETRVSTIQMHILLNRLFIFCVATGAFTVLVDIIALILTIAQPSSLAFTSAILVQTRLYANSLLASLNMRKANVQAYNDAMQTPVELSSGPMQFAHPPTTQSAISENTGHPTEAGQRKGTMETWYTAVECQPLDP